MPQKTYNSRDLPPTMQTRVAGLLQQGDTVHFAAFGPSMNPVIRSGESVQVRPASEKDLHPGAILLFTYHGRLVMHRLVRRNRDGRLVTIADAALDGADAVDKADVIGVATSVHRGKTERRLDTRRARGYGLLRYHARPLRRLITRLLLQSR